MARTDSIYDAVRTSNRPLDHNGYGHYRAVTYSGAAAGLTAGQIISSLWWKDTSRKFVLTRLAMNIEVLTAITTACVFDAQAFVTRGITAASSGAGSSTLAATGNFQKAQANMGSSLLTGSGGELRTVGTTTPITAAAGKTNDGAPFGAAFWGSLFNSTSTGTAVLVSPGAAITPGGFQDLFSLSPYNSPIVLAANEGIEIQVITANNATGTVKYGFLWEWAETDKY
jgi:hypothetical protein